MGQFESVQIVTLEQDYFLMDLVTGVDKYPRILEKNEELFRIIVTGAEIHDLKILT